MKKGHKILALFILGLFAVSFLSGIVSAVTVGERVQGWLSGAGDGILDVTKGTISKFLLIILVFMIVYSIFNFIPLVPKGEWPHWGISITVAILSFIFVGAEDIRYILATYEGLGIALTTVLPLIIILAFTIQLRKSDYEYAGLINKMVIILFAVYIGIRWFTITWGLDEKVLIKTNLTWLYPITLVVLIIWLFIEKGVYFKMFKALLEGDVEKAGKYLLTDYSAQMQRLIDQEKTATGATLGEIEKEIADLNKKIKKAKGPRIITIPK